MPTRPLRWGLLSTAHINRALITPLRISARNKLAAVASRSQATADAYAKEWHIPTAHGSYEALLADPEIDVIYNSLPNHLHAEWTIRAMEAGKHVLCEKPISLSLAEVEAIAATAQKTGQVVAEAFMYRHHPQTLKALEIARSGTLGKIKLVRGSFTYVIKTEVNIRLSPEMGGGSLWDVGCYPLSYTRAVLGMEPSEVFGWQVNGPSGVEDTFVAQLKFPGEVFAQFDSSFSIPLHVFMEIIGSEATLIIPHPYKPGLDEKIFLTREEKNETLKIKGEELYLGEVEDMADCILKGKVPRITLADSRANVAAMLALIESARSGQPVKL